MKLYHASKHRFDVIKRSHAQHPAAEEFDVPAGELQNKIYFTPDLGFAIAMAAGPDGMTSLVDGSISFENADQFDSQRPVYVYIVESESIAKELIEKVDDEQVAVDLDELIPEEIREFTAQDVFNYYKLTNWKHPNG
jgi:hypothetical protein